MSTKLVKGTAVVSLADGVKLGVVDHVYLDPARKEIVAFSFHSGGLLGGKTTHLVDVADVHAIGPDAVTLDDASGVRSQVAVTAKCDGLVDLDELLKRKVITEGGSLVGKVAAVAFGEDTYRLAQIEVSPEGHGGRVAIPAAAIDRIGDDLIVVAEPASAAAPAQLVRVA